MTRWVRTCRSAFVGLLGLLLVGCSDAPQLPAAVCDPLGEPLEAVDYPVDRSERTVADVLVRLRDDLRGDSRTVTIYLDPASSADPQPLFDLVTDIAGDKGVVLLDQAASLAEYREIFGQTSPELVEAVTDDALPASARLHTDDLDLVDELLDAVDAAGFDVYRIVDSADGGVPVGRGIHRAGDDVLVRLADQEEDETSAAAAATIIEHEGPVDTDEGALEEAYLDLAEAADECGLLDD